MKLITRRSHDGSERSCNSHCYNSTHHTCNCICKGLMHGKGEAYAKLMASKASFYLQLQDRSVAQYFLAPELVKHIQGG